MPRINATVGAKPTKTGNYSQFTIANQRNCIADRIRMYESQHFEVELMIKEFELCGEEFNANERRTVAENKLKIIAMLKEQLEKLPAESE